MRLLFVYNAESGLVNGMLDSIHKVVSPHTYECALCRITHGLVTMDRVWRTYLQSLPIETVFHHRRDFHAAYPAADMPLPVVLLDRGGELTELLSAAQLGRLADVNALSAALDAALTAAGVCRPGHEPA